MSVDREQSQGRLTGARVSRRQFNKGATEAALSAAALATAIVAGGLAWELRPEKQDSLVGKDVPGKQVEHYLTDAAGEFDQIPLRKSPKLGDEEIIGWTKPEADFWAKEEYGVVYPSGFGVGKVNVNGEDYGIWYRGAGLPLFDREQRQDGGYWLKPRYDENMQVIKSGTVHVAGNFLKRVPQENQHQDPLSGKGQSA